MVLLFNDFPYFSMASKSKLRRGRVRRAKLYYLRDRVGKAAKVKELIKKKAD